MYQTRFSVPVGDELVNAVVAPFQGTCRVMTWFVGLHPTLLSFSPSGTLPGTDHAYAKGLRQLRAARLLPEEGRLKALGGGRRKDASVVCRDQSAAGGSRPVREGGLEAGLPSLKNIRAIPTSSRITCVYNNV